MSHFPELARLGEAEHEKVVEQARYNTFVLEKESGRWVRGTIVSVVLIFALGIFVGLFAEVVLGVPIMWATGFTGGFGACFLGWYQQRRYVTLLRPKVATLCAGWSSSSGETVQCESR